LSKSGSPLLAALVICLHNSKKMIFRWSQRIPERKKSFSNRIRARLQPENDFYGRFTTNYREKLIRHPW
jgi:hypothetical protein